MPIGHARDRERPVLNDEHTWAVESVDGLGFLLGQQLVAIGERVLDVPATLAARVRVLGSGRSQKTDANDGYSSGSRRGTRRSYESSNEPTMRRCCGG